MVVGVRLQNEAAEHTAKLPARPSSQARVGIRATRARLHSRCAPAAQEADKRLDGLKASILSFS